MLPPDVPENRAMNRVTIATWPGLIKEEEGEPQLSSRHSSVGEVEVEKGATIRQLLDVLARNNSFFAQEIFDLETKRLQDSVVMTYNGRVISACEAYERILDDGDKITILPVYPGG